MNYSTPGVNKPTLIERLWAWLMLLLMIAMGSIVFLGAVLIHDARAQVQPSPSSRLHATDEWQCNSRGDQEACEREAHEPIRPARWRPWQRAWQCNDIRVTETGIEPGVIHYDLAGTIWGGSQFVYDLNHGVMVFNGRPCVPLL